MAPTSVTLAAPPAHALHPFDGFGAQFNTNLFTDAGQPQSLSAAQHGQLSDAVANLKPGHSRIFLVRGVHAAVPPASKQGKELAALMKTIELADAAGANVNLTYWGQGPYANEAKLRALDWPNPTVKKWPQPGKQKWPAALTDGTIVAPAQSMARFAGIVEKARDAGFGCITHLTIQNEVNGSSTDIAKQRNPNLSMRLYELLYRQLDSALKAIPDPHNPGRSLRAAVQIVAGDLVKASRASSTATRSTSTGIPAPALRASRRSSRGGSRTSRRR
jgi:hypothetical protein